MIQKQSRLEVADNSGAKEIMCIHITGGTKKRYAYLGDRIKCSIKKAIPGGLVKKGEVHNAVIVRTRKEFRRRDGSYVRFGQNAVVILNKDYEPIGTRIFGPVPLELKEGYVKIISLAPETV